MTTTARTINITELEDGLLPLVDDVDLLTLPLKLLLLTIIICVFGLFYY
jgi:hypothetical protein